MMKGAVFFGILILLFACVDNYEFEVKNDTPTLVVEGFISNKSYNDTRNYPSDGRYFFVKIKQTGNVTNRHDKVVSNANISLIDSDSISINYVESLETPGTYFIVNPDFAAIPNKKYKLYIILPDGEEYESDWEEMVDENTSQMGDVCYDEVEKKVYRWEANEQNVVVEQGLNILIGVPQNENASPLYYRWNFTPTWIYIAPLSSVSDNAHKCWVTSDLYLNSYTLLEDQFGGYDAKILYMSLYRNERIFEKLSILIEQQIMTERYYRFWKEMKDQSQRGGLFDAPPYNLDSNIKNIGDSSSYVSGYFGVVKEQATRWYFTKKELSPEYYLEDFLRYECIYYQGPPPARVCYNCLLYDYGQPTLIKPIWWKD